MYSLILVLITIALVASLSLASLYYGGFALSRGAVNSRTAQMLAEATQVQGAVQLFYAENGRNPSGPNELVEDGKYLKAFPQQWGGGPAYLATTPLNTAVSQDSCVLFNQRRLGISSIPSCADPLYKDQVICCEEPPVMANP